MRMSRFYTALVLLLLSSAAYAQPWKTLTDIPIKLAFPVVVEMDGKIHIMGGGGPSGASTAHYQYDPATNKWVSKASVPYAAQQPAGAAVGGKIHFFGGGFPNSGSPVDSHYVYDPKTDSWSAAAKLSAPRAIHDAVGLNGKLYSLGGQGMKDLCEVYDPSTDKWTKLGNLPDQNFWYGAHVSDGKNIYRFCGGGYTSPVKAAHIYDPATDKWSALPDFPESVHALSASITNGVIYLTGGYFDFEERKEVWAFDPSTKAYSTITSMPEGRNYHRTVAINGCIYVLAGNNQLNADMGVNLSSWCPWPLNVPKTTPQSQVTMSFETSQLLIHTPARLDEQAQLAVYDINGKQVHTQTLQLDQTQLQVPLQLQKGSAYLVRLQGTSTLTTQKLIYH